MLTGSVLGQPAPVIIITSSAAEALMETVVFIILLAVALIDGKLWKVVLEQRRHNKAVEALLADIRDRSGPPR